VFASSGHRSRGLVDVPPPLCTASQLQTCLGGGFACGAVCDGNATIAADAGLMHECKCICLNAGVQCSLDGGCSMGVLRAAMKSTCGTLACTAAESPVCGTGLGGVQTCGNTQVRDTLVPVCACTIVGVCTRSKSQGGWLARPSGRRCMVWQCPQPIMQHCN
jgi:hypothetical protein